MKTAYTIKTCATAIVMSIGLGSLVHASKTTIDLNTINSVGSLWGAVNKLECNADICLKELEKGFNKLKTLGLFDDTKKIISWVESSYNHAIPLNKPFSFTSSYMKENDNFITVNDKDSLSKLTKAWAEDFKLFFTTLKYQELQKAKSNRTDIENEINKKEQEIANLQPGFFKKLFSTCSPDTNVEKRENLKKMIINTLNKEKEDAEKTIKNLENELKELTNNPNTITKKNVQELEMQELETQKNDDTIETENNDLSEVFGGMNEVQEQQEEDREELPQELVQEQPVVATLTQQNLTDLFNTWQPVIDKNFNPLESTKTESFKNFVTLLHTTIELLKTTIDKNIINDDVKKCAILIQTIKKELPGMIKTWFDAKQKEINANTDDIKKTAQDIMTSLTKEGAIFSLAEKDNQCQYYTLISTIQKQLGN